MWCKQYWDNLCGRSSHFRLLSQLTHWPFAQHKQTQVQRRNASPHCGRWILIRGPEIYFVWASKQIRNMFRFWANKLVHPRMVWGSSGGLLQQMLFFDCVKWLLNHIFTTGFGCCVCETCRTGGVLFFCAMRFMFPTGEYVMICSSEASQPSRKGSSARFSFISAFCSYSLD